MKRPVILFILFVSCFAGAIAHAQQRTTINPQATENLGLIVNGARRTVRFNGAWWTNEALVQRLGLTDEQKARVERAYENHRQRLLTNTQSLEKEEAQLAQLLEAEQIDRNAILSQIDRVVQARGEVERVNSAMTLEMREALTRAQWAQLPVVSWLPAPGSTNEWGGAAIRLRTDQLNPPPGGAGGRGQRNPAGQGGRGGRGTPGQQ
jgi:Spy/CpxP family protein refolding chaperone